jgi:outer membrane protein assembly factor BamB
MFGCKRITVLILCMVSAMVVFNGFSSIAEGKASRYKDPVSDPDFHVDIYIQNKAFRGTTLFFDIHKPNRPRIIEMDMQGRIVWEYVVPWNMKQNIQPGPDVEWLPNNNILAMFPRKGVYEINRKGDIVWSYKDSKISHDADRLPNGNTLVVFGANDQKGDAQVKEIDKKGKIVWAWHAKDYFDKPPYKDISWQGWTHTNAVSRLPNGNTLISLRNFCFGAEVNAQGSVVRTIGEGVFYSPHDPEALSNGNVLIANQSIPPRALKGYPNEMASNILRKQPRWHQAIELDPNTGTIVWQSFRFVRPELPVRDADRLPNGNTLITASSRLVEVTKEGEIVWELKVKLTETQPDERIQCGFYKAERIAPH